MGNLRNPRPVLFAATVFAVLAAFFAHAYFTQRTQADEASKSRVTVAVATSEIKPGTIIRREMVGLSERPMGELPRGAVHQPTALVGQVSTKPIAAGQILSDDMVVAANSSLGPAYSLPPSMRAITVSADAVTGIAGFLKPGNRVDVIATFNRGQDASTRVVLQDVQVLAVGSDTQPNVAGGPNDQLKNARTNGQHDVPVTVAVTLPEAERLVLADTRGKIRLALRSANGGDYASAAGALESQVSGLPSETATLAKATAEKPAAMASILPVSKPEPMVIAKPVLPKEPAKPAEHKITIVRGTQVETVSFPDAAKDRAGEVNASENGEGAPHK